MTTVMTTKTTTKTFVRQVSDLYKSDLEKYINTTTFTRERANLIFKELFANTGCLSFMRKILNQESSQDRFYGFDLISKDRTLVTHLSEYRKEISNCNKSTHFISLKFETFTAHIIGAYQNACFAPGVNDIKDYDDTWDNGIIIELN